MRIPVNIEVDIRAEIPTREQGERFIQPWRAEVLIGGQPTGAYAKMEVARYESPHSRIVQEELAQYAVRSFIDRLNKALSIAKEQE